MGWGCVPRGHPIRHFHTLERAPGHLWAMPHSSAQASMQIEHLPVPGLHQHGRRRAGHTLS